MADQVSSGEDVTQKKSHQDQQSNKESCSSLPPLPRLPLPLPDQTFMRAAAVFQRLRPEKPGGQQLLHYGKKPGERQAQSGDRRTQRRAYQLAFSTLTYQDLLEEIIADSCFHTTQHTPSDLLPLAMVMLFDFQDRSFSLCQHSGKEGGESLQEVRDLERSLQRCKTKLAASLARCRVKQRLQSVSGFLSDPLRTREHRAKRLPLYAWVNTLGTSVDQVCDTLQSLGLCEAKSLSDLGESAICRDPLCPDTLVFSQRLHARLRHSGLPVLHSLHTQDRSVCLAVSALRPLLFEHADVLVGGSFSAETVAHIAAVATARSGRVLVCAADHTPPLIEEMQELLAQMDIRNVRVLSESFCSLRQGDATVQHLKVIIVLPRCSSSALSNPVDTILGEHGDVDLLPDLSRGCVSPSKVREMATQQARLLAHALSFSKVQTVVYCTRSVYPEENEQLVKRVLEKTYTHPKTLPFRVNGPIFPDDAHSGDKTDPVFFRLQPSEFTNGCFVARLSRQADPTKVETVQDVLARAAAKGLLGGIIPEQTKTDKKEKCKKARSASACSKPSSPAIQESQTGNELEDGKDPVPESGEGRGECSAEPKKDTGKGRKKRRGPKGSKRKVKQRPKRASGSATVAKHRSKDHKKKTAKKQVKQSYYKRRAAKSKQIPRLTLTLISSTNPSRHLSSITALAHKLSEKVAPKSHRAASSGRSPACPAPPAPHAASSQLQRHKMRPRKVEERLKDVRAESPLKARGKPDRSKTETAQKTPDCVSSGSCKTSSSSRSQVVQRSASSSSSVSLPVL